MTKNLKVNATPANGRADSCEWHSQLALLSVGQSMGKVLHVPKIHFS